MKKLLLLLSISLLFIINTFAQVPVANFSGTPLTGCGVTLVNFTDLSTNTPNAWNWDFGDGTIHATIKNPSHAYTNPGTYTVTLIATNGYGSDTEIKTGYIVIHAFPTPNFTANFTSGCAPLTVHFTDQSTSPGTTITNWLWDFGDGGTSTLQNPNHTYVNPGTYTVTLSVTNGFSCQKNIIKSNYITVYPVPVANFTSTNHVSCVPPLNVSFTSTSTGNGLTYLWNFGDGGTSTAQNPSHNYTTSGSFNVTLIVTNSNGCKDTIFQPGWVQVNTFQAAFSAPVLSGCAPFTGSFTSTGSGITNWTWYFGDGGYLNGVWPAVGHTYTVPGTYTVTLIATNSYGCIDTVVMTNYITVLPNPIVTFTSNKTTGCSLPLTVNFTNTTPGTTSWNWNFGDGGTSTLQNPSHTYTSWGSYNVTLTVVGSNGCTGTVTMNNFITIAPITLSISSDVDKGCVPLPVNFNWSSNSLTPVTGWTWDFGDGSPTSSLSTPLHIYTDTGSYNVTLTIVNTEGCTATGTFTSFINAGMPPVTNFYAEDTVGCHKFNAVFHDSSSTYVDFWYWQFGDGGTSNQQDPQHEYTDTGYFTVTLITQFHGCADTLIKTNYIHVLPPKPQFGFLPSWFSCVDPYTVTFVDQSQGADEWLWHFGDGTSSTLQNPVHTYLDPGFYTVWLIVGNTTNGCHDSTNYSYIGVSEIIPGFEANPTVTCLHNAVTFTDTTYSNVMLSNWNWDFGDGFSMSGPFPTISHIYDTVGVFTVSLIVSNAWGCADTIVKNNLVTIHGRPSPRFVSDTLWGCVPLLTNFTDQSLPYNPAAITNWSWDLGNGFSSTQQNPSTTYFNPGLYTVTLTITDANGCDSTLIKPNYISLTRPTPLFTVDSITCYVDSVHFNNISTGEGVLSYSWDFDDGSPLSTDINPVHLYNVAGSAWFNVALTVTDGNGCDSTYIKPIKISRPVVNFYSDTTTSECPPLWVTFSDSSSLDVVTWLWDFGDTLSGSSNLSAAENPQHVFNNAGSFDITLIVTNADGCTDTLFRPDYIFVDGPHGSFDFFPKFGCGPLTVTFTSNGVNVANYLWVFGDGNTATGPTTTYTYNTGGFYIPVLIITDSLQPGETTPCEVAIVSPDTIKLVSGTPLFSVDYDTICPNMPVQFTDLSTAIPNISGWTWNFGDGGTSTDQNPTHTYTTFGDYDVTLTIHIDTCDYTLTIPDFVNVMSTPPVFFFVPDSTKCYPALIDFIIIDSTIFSPVQNWEWNFNDGTPLDTNKNPSHYFYNSGTYNITLTVHFVNGCEVTTTTPVGITVYPLPVAICTTDSNNVFSDVPLTFIDLSTGNGINNWQWSFGDGATSTDQNPVHAYDIEGTFQIQLIVTSADGCKDTSYCTVDIIEGLIVPNVFTPNGDGFNDDFEILFSSTFSEFSLKIYDRWGLRIFYTTDFYTRWDGTRDDGVKVPDGVYFWVLEGTSGILGKSYLQQGTVTMIR